MPAYARLTGVCVLGESPEKGKVNHQLSREPCVAVREGSGEASAAVHVGEAIERRKLGHPERRDSPYCRRQHAPVRFGEDRRALRRRRTIACMQSSTSRNTAGTPCPCLKKFDAARKESLLGHESNVTHWLQQSMPFNRAGPKENSTRQSRHHAQEWARLSHAADRVRQAATPAVCRHHPTEEPHALAGTCGSVRGGAGQPAFLPQSWGGMNPTSTSVANDNEFACQEHADA